MPKSKSKPKKIKEPDRSFVPFELPDRIDMNYNYSFGGISPFFLALRDEGKILGARCVRCKKTYLPPRINCSQCYRQTKWVPLGTEGTVKTCTTVYYATSRFFSKTPFVCAYIQLDGADTLLLQNIVLDDVTQARPGMRVRALFKPERKGEISDFYFVPAT